MGEPPVTCPCAISGTSVGGRAGRNEDLPHIPQPPAHPATTRTSRNLPQPPRTSRSLPHIPGALTRKRGAGRAGAPQRGADGGGASDPSRAASSTSSARAMTHRHRCAGARRSSSRDYRQAHAGSRPYPPARSQSAQGSRRGRARAQSDGEQRGAGDRGGRSRAPGRRQAARRRRRGGRTRAPSQR
jgi:hypothetical protein